jgi:hypothetical protein
MEFSVPTQEQKACYFGATACLDINADDVAAKAASDPPKNGQR